ncbi:hypothetical protein Bca4012_032529 [Brassica carinata]
MTEDDGDSDDSETNLLRNRNQLKRDVHSKNAVRFLRNNAWCDIGAKLQQRDEDTTPFHESVTTFPTICVAREWPEQQAFVE